MKHINVKNKVYNYCQDYVLPKVSVEVPFNIRREALGKLVGSLVFRIHQPVCGVILSQLREEISNRFKD